MDKHMPKDEIRDYAPNEKDDILYLLEEVNRTARRTFDALIVGLDLNQTQWRIIRREISVCVSVGSRNKDRDFSPVRA